MDAEGLKVALVRKGPEIPEGAPGAQPDRGPDAVPGEVIEAAARRPDERHAQPEPAANGPLLSSGRHGPDADEEDVPVGLAARRPVETAGHVDVAVRSERVERIGLVGPVIDGEAGGAKKSDRDDRGDGGRPVGAAGEESPGRRDTGRGQAPRGKRREGHGLRRGDAEAQRGSEKNEGEGAGPQIS